MWLPITITFIIGFYDVIDMVFQNVPPWMTIIITLTIYKTSRILSSWMRFRLAYGTTYFKLVSGLILRVLRTYVPWVRR